MEDTNKVDEILARHKGLEGYDEYDRKPVTEGGEIFQNLDDPRLISRNSDGTNEDRRCWVILRELEGLGLSVDHKLAQTHMEMSVSIKGKMLQHKENIAQGIMKSKSGSGGIGNLFVRQPAEGEVKQP